MNPPSSSSSPSAVPPAAQLFREIHKNAWLRHIPDPDSKGLLPTSNKRCVGSCYWVVFCVHCDSSPYLEFYVEPAAAAGHQPRWRHALRGCTAVSGGLVPTRGEHRLVLAGDAGLTLAAPTWEDMRDWVDTLRNKLREMKILQPGENVYSKAPEASGAPRARAPTRDPTSPLPPPPPGPATRVPGIEIPHSPRTSNDQTENERRTVAAESNANRSETTADDTSRSERVLDELIRNHDTTLHGNRINDNLTRNNDSTTRINDNPTRPNENITRINDNLTRAHEGATRINDNLIRINENTTRMNENLSRNHESATRINDNLIRTNENIARNNDNVIRTLDSTPRINDNIIRTHDNTSRINDTHIRTPNNLARTHEVPVRTNDSLIRIGENVPRTNDNSRERSRNNSTTNPDDPSRLLDDLVRISSSDGSVGVEGSVVGTRIHVSQPYETLRVDSTEGKERYENHIVTVDSNSMVVIRTDKTIKGTHSKSDNHVDATNRGQSDGGGDCASQPPPRLAKISGMNVCLGDSLLGDSREGMFEETGHDEGTSLQVSGRKEDESTPVTTVKRDSKGYTQVDLNTKRNVVGLVTKHNQTNLAMEDTISGTDDNSNRVEDISSSGIYVSLAAPSADVTQTVSTRVKPQIVERKKIYLNRTSSVPDAVGSEEILMNHRGEMVPGSSNVTVISLPSQTPPPPPHARTEKDAPSEQKKSTTSRYVNVCLLNSEPEKSTSKTPSRYERISEAASTDNDANVSTLEVRDGTGAELYESVFTPFKVVVDGDVAKRDKIVVHVPKLVVNAPKAEQENQPDRSVNEDAVTTVSGASETVGNGTGATTEGDYEYLSWIRSGDRERRVVLPPEENQRKNQPAESKPAARQGLFSRGLTELNIMSKFRSLSLLKASPSSPASAAPKTSLPGQVSRVLRTESSLRRNWSEHNDRTAPVVRNNENKMSRPPPPARPANPSDASAPGPSPRRQPTSQTDSRADRRRSNSLSSARISTDDTSSSQPLVMAKPSIVNQGGVVMSLREQQVLRLRGEISHAGGVRLLLSARDCPDQAVALVDIYAGVWVAGWKQRSHPLLYNALHIGDRLSSVGGVMVSSARQARRAMQTTHAQKVEMIIKRLPHGRVYALKRDTDKQDLGLILESATIVGVVPNSPAARGGVLPTGTLTEVNGRPLNLLLKKGDSQVKDRLNSVGRDVSILVQPTEFVSLLRTALKALRSHKDYIVQ